MAAAAVMSSRGGQAVDDATRRRVWMMQGIAVAMEDDDINNKDGWDR